MEEVIGDFSVTVHEANVFAVHREHLHRYNYLRSPDAPYICLPPSWWANGLADRAPGGFIDSATEAVLLKLKRDKLIP